MTERQQFEAEEKKIRILSTYNYTCVRCGRRAYFLAHCIPQTQINLKKYGHKVIHHFLNMKPVCANSRCNDAVSISNQPLVIEKLVKQIQAEIISDQKIPS